ncbi:MAG: hypothetical protein WCN98_04980, partial [Verrucomicrobiaceae bacterium]
VDETQQLPCGGAAHFPCSDFFVFQKNLGRDGLDQPAIDQRLANDLPRAITAEHSQNDVGVDADRH